MRGSVNARYLSHSGSTFNVSNADFGEISIEFEFNTFFFFNMRLTCSFGIHCCSAGRLETSSGRRMVHAG